jgi:MoaA/NifB/PqqE/SkfB family radical SAM enzyme
MSRPLLLNTTSYCNARCHFCVVLDKLNDPHHIMGDEEIYRALDQARAEGSTEVGYSGGEPSIDPRIVDIVKYAKKIGFTRQSMNTNGIKFKQKDFCREIVEAGLTQIDFSIHGDTDELHNGLVSRKGALAAIREACSNLQALQREYRFLLSGTIVVARSNHTRLRQICELFTELGLTSTRLKYAYEANMSFETVIEQVAPYEDVAPSLIEAIDYLATSTYGFHFTHIPFCVMGDHAVFSQDFERRPARLVFRNDHILGDAAQYFRKDGDECGRCVLNNLCTRLDGGYERHHGRPQLKPFESNEQVDAMFERAEQRFPVAKNLVRRVRDIYLRNREVTTPLGIGPGVKPAPEPTTPLVQLKTTASEKPAEAGDVVR